MLARAFALVAALLALAAAVLVVLGSFAYPMVAVVALVFLLGAAGARMLARSG